MDARKAFGTTGEQLAGVYLQSKGFQILAQQYRTRFGEIDLICQDGDEVVFVEVKTRRSDQYGYPEAAVTPEKIGKMMKVISAYRSRYQLEEIPWRIDVIAIVYASKDPDILHIANIDIPEKFW